MIEKNDLHAIISLLDDEDPKVFSLLKNQLKEFGSELLPLLNDAMDNTISPVMLGHLQDIFSEMNYENAKSELLKWKESSAQNLFQALIIFERFCKPKLDLEKFNNQISKIRQELWLEVNDNLTALEKIRVINRVFYDLNGFRGDMENISKPENSFLNEMLSRKKGNPITMSILYSMLAQSVNIPIYGVNMPKQFMLAYVSKMLTQPDQNILLTDVLFYINPFNRGEIYSANEVRVFLNHLHIKASDDILLPCSHLVIVKRCLVNLINAFKIEGNQTMVDNFESFLELLQE